MRSLRGARWSLLDKAPGIAHRVGWSREEAMDKAERTLPIPEHAASDLATNAAKTVSELRGQLDRIMKVAE